MEKFQAVDLVPNVLVFSMLDSACVKGEMAALLTCNHDYPHQSTVNIHGALFNHRLAVNLTTTGLMNGNEFLGSTKGEGEIMNFNSLSVQNSWFSLHLIEYLCKGTTVKKQ